MAIAALSVTPAAHPSSEGTNDGPPERPGDRRRSGPTGLALLSALVASVACAACSSSTPTAPSTGCEFTGVYLLDIVPSPSCGTTATGTFEVAMVQLRVIPAQDGSRWRFSLPTPIARPVVAVPNSGDLVVDLTIDGTHASGTLGGWGLANNAIHAVEVSAADDPGQPAPASGTVTPGTSPSINGTVHGTVTWSVYQTPTAGACTAPDHRFQLRKAPT